MDRRALLLAGIGAVAAGLAVRGEIAAHERADERVDALERRLVDLERTTSERRAAWERSERAEHERLQAEADVREALERIKRGEAQRR